MNHTHLPQSWSDALHTLSLDSGSSAPPSGESSPWYGASMRFGKLGFCLIFLRPAPSLSEGVQLRIDFAHPNPARGAELGVELAARLETLGASAARFDGEATPLRVSATFPALSEEKVRDILTLLLKVSDHLLVSEQDGNAPSPLERAEGELVLPLTTQTPAGFESIGRREAAAPAALASTPDASASAPTASVTPAPSRSPFETIGAGTPEKSASTREEAPSAPPRITSHRLQLTPQALELELEVAPTQPHEVVAQLTRGLEKTLRTRFDVEASPLPQHVHEGKSVLGLSLRPALTTATSKEMELLRDDLARYLQKLESFNKMGLALPELLNVTPEAPRTSPASGRTPRTERTTLVDIPSRRSEPTPATSATTSRSTEPQGGGEGIVLDLGGASSGAARDTDSPQQSGMPAASDALSPGAFTDARLRREDANTALVDVILRHPGYSDKNMSKVLSILLSIEYSKAQALIERAPCVLAWGTSNERGQTMKSVIEGAGGKVVIVEPDTFPAR